MKPDRKYIEYLIANNEVLNFGGWDLSNLDLSELDLRGANFKDADCTNLNLSKSDLRNSFGPANTELQLEYTNLSGKQFHKTRIEARSMQGVDFSNIYLNRVDASTNIFSFLKAENATFDVSNFQGCDLRKATIYNSNIELCDFRGANLQDAVFTNCNFKDSDFRGSILRNVNFINCDLSNAKLQRTDLREAKLIKTRLNGAYYSTKTKWSKNYSDYINLCILDPDRILDEDDDCYNEQDEYFLRPLYGPWPGEFTLSSPKIELVNNRIFDKELVFSSDGNFLLSCGGEYEPISWQIISNLTLQDRFIQINSNNLNFVPTPNLSSKFTLNNSELRTPTIDLMVEPVPSSTQYGAYTVRLTEKDHFVDFIGHHNYPISVIAIGPNRNYLASGDCGGYIKIWNVVDRKEMYSLWTNGGLIRSLAFSPDGHYLIAGDEGIYRNQGMFVEGDYEDNDALGMLYVIDVATGKFVRGLIGGGRPVRCIAFHPSGEFFASINGSSIVIWEKNW